MRNARRCSAARFLPAALILLLGQAPRADLLDAAEEAADNGQDYMEVAITGIYQFALQAGEDTGNIEIDLIGAKTLLHLLGVQRR
jgi:hypothetical protein